MSVIWYDNAIEPDPADPSWLDIERIYCFDWDAFTDSDWKQLGSIYSLLPGYESNCTDLPRWFSPVDDPQGGYLWASVEPPGLQVAGTLHKESWLDWDKRFRGAIEALPFRRLE